MRETAFSTCCHGFPGWEEVAGPRFVFAHILPPHPSHLFDRHGESLLHGELGDVWRNREHAWSSWASLRSA